MSLISSTNLQSITLKPGEQFTLPPGAAVLSATDVNTLDSTCPLTDLEETACFVSLIAAAGEEGNVSQYFESSQATVIGYRLNKKNYLFDRAYPAIDDGTFNTTEMLADLVKKLGGIVMATAAGTDSNGERGALTYLVIRTIASIADNLSIILQSSIPHSGNGGSFNQTLNVYAPFEPYDTLSGQNYISLPACPA